jgi:hypothetical protein
VAAEMGKEEFLRNQRQIDDEFWDFVHKAEGL